MPPIMESAVLKNNPLIRKNKWELVHYLASTWPLLHSNKYSWIPINDWVTGKVSKVSRVINILKLERKKVH